MLVYCVFPIPIELSFAFQHKVCFESGAVVIFLAVPTSHISSMVSLAIDTIFVVACAAIPPCIVIRAALGAYLKFFRFGAFGSNVVFYGVSFETCSDGDVLFCFYCVCRNTHVEPKDAFSVAFFAAAVFFKGDFEYFCSGNLEY